MSHTPDLIIVEDEADTRSLLSQIFTMRGFRVRAAEDGFAALRLIRSALPDILLSDLNMPGMTGFELLSVVRRLYPGIHVIATSGAYSGTSVPEGIAADGFHEKATGTAGLFALVARGAMGEHDTFHSRRMSTPLWVDLECRLPFDSDSVLVSCPSCLRPFRQLVDEVNAEIRKTDCSYCGSHVAYAIALPIKPPAAFNKARAEAAGDSRSAASARL